tara:strand:- start:235 stop:408 length:174 start_codon:yes stop_codon:yes gene_type:complete
MNFTSTNKKQVRKPVSYGGHEHRVMDMEAELMNHYGYNFSQLHKTLVREKYYQLRSL